MEKEKTKFKCPKCGEELKKLKGKYKFGVNINHISGEGGQDEM